MDLDELKKLEIQLISAGREERAAEAEAADLLSFQVLIFELGSERYSLRITDIVEVVKTGKIFPVPSAPTYVAGVINLRGEIVCVVDAMKKMEMGETATGDETRVVVTRYEKSSVGLLVDRIIDVADIHEKDIHPLPAEHVSSCIEGDVRVGDDAFRLLRAAEVLKRE